MAQKKITKEHGTHLFVKTWVNATGAHIGLLEGGGYLHFSGLPISHKGELTEVIPPGPDRVKAEQWWENRGKEIPEIPKKKIIFTHDGNLLFDDGSPVKSVSDIINNTPSGAVQEAYLKVYHAKKEQEEKAKMREDTRINQTTKKLKTEALSKEMVE